VRIVSENRCIYIRESNKNKNDTTCLSGGWGGRGGGQDSFIVPFGSRTKTILSPTVKMSGRFSSSSISGATAVGSCCS